MTEKIVKGVDIVEKGALTEHIEQAKQLLVVYSQLDVEVKSTATSLAKISKGFKATKSGDIGNAKAASDNMTKAMLEQERIAQAQIRTKKSLLQLEKLQEAQTNRNIKNLEQERSAYKQLTAQTNAAQAELKRLATVFGVNSKEAKKAQAAFDVLDKKLSEVNKLARDGRRDVGRYADKIKEAVRELYAERDALQSTDKELRQKIKTVNKGSKEYNLYQTQLNQVNQRLKVVNQSIHQTNNTTNIFQKSLNGLTNVLGKLGLAMGAGIVFQDGIKTLIDFDERLADIAKTTGLSVESAKALSNELLKIDTRTSVDGLQQLAVAAGRLGIQGKQNIIDFVAAADKSFVALGDDLGGTADEIATSLGKISSVFGDEQEFGVGEAILKTGSALNELSANSKASAGNILDFTNRMAGVASVAGIAQTDIQALGAFFDDAGQSIEVAATTLNVLLPELSKDQERFAKVAGLTAEEFGAMLQNAPIEALKAVAIGAKSSEGGLNGLVQTLEGFGIEAARGTAIVGTLASGVDELTRLQGISNVAFAEGTSLTNEFNIKNQTTGALLEKLKKEWDKQILGIGGSTAASEKFRGALTFLIKNLGTILDVAFKLGKAFLVYKTTVLALNVATKAQMVLTQGLGTTLKNLFVAQNSVTGAVDKGTNSIKLFGLSLNAIPFAAIITGIVSLVSSLETYEEAMQKAILVQDEFAEKGKALADETIAASATKIQQLYDSGLGLYDKNISKGMNKRDAFDKASQSIAAQAKFERAQLVKELNETIQFLQDNKGKLSTEVLYEKTGYAENLKTQIETLEVDLKTIQTNLWNSIQEKGVSAENNYKKAIDGTNDSLNKRSKVIDEIIEKEEDVRQLIDVPPLAGVGFEFAEVDNGMDAYFEEQQRLRDEAAAAEEKRVADLIQLSQDLTDITTFLTDRRIEAIDREIEAEKRKYDESKQNIDAIIAMREMDSNSMAQSIAFEKKQQAEALAAQEKLQRRKQRLELLNTSISMLNAQVAAGNGNALGKTMADVTTLIGFIKSIPMFWEGTETTVGDTVGTKFSNGRDGILARVDKSEMILNKSKVDKLAAMGIHSTDDVVKRLMLGNSISNVPTSMVAMNDNSDVVNELAEHRALLKQLVNKPVTNTTLEQVGKVVKMIETVNKPHRNIVTVKQKRIS